MSLLDSDDDDPDYVPGQHGNSIDEASTKSNINEKNEQEIRVGKAEALPTDVDEQNRAAIWEQFKNSTASPSEEMKEVKYVRVIKRILFAGEEMTEIVDVPENSQDAKLWPRSAETKSGAAKNEGPLASSSSAVSASSKNDHENCSTSNKISTTLKRKCRKSLGEIPHIKTKKISTLDKSLLDWNSHLNGGSKEVREELEANRKGGGYIEKVEFMERVSDRRDEGRASSGSKRRKL